MNILPQVWGCFTSHWVLPVSLIKYLRLISHLIISSPCKKKKIQDGIPYSFRAQTQLFVFLLLKILPHWLSRAHHMLPEPSLAWWTQFYFSVHSCKEHLFSVHALQRPQYYFRWNPDNAALAVSTWVWKPLLEDIDWYPIYIEIINIPLCYQSPHFTIKII